MAFWGDVMPFVPIANELSARGHDVTFAVPEGFWPMLESELFSLAPAGTQFSPRELEAHGDLLERASSPLGTARAARFWISEFGVRPLRSIHAALMDATTDADLVLTHPTAAFAARMVAEQRDIPWVTGHLFPMLIPTTDHLPPGWPLEKLVHRPSKRHARLAWTAVEGMSARVMYDREINAQRVALGLLPVHANAMVGGLSPFLVLLLWSPLWAPPASDWPEHYTATGFTIWPGPTGQALPAKLSAYLDVGDPPVLVTLGTSAASNAGDLFETVAEVLDRTARRGVFLIGSTKHVSARMAARPDVWEFAPITKVLPRCSAVVHAGGHGTTAAALVAGVPSVVVPMLFDQRWHALRAQELGVGAYVARGRAFAPRLERALDAIVDGPGARAAAAALGPQIGAENGPSGAADKIEAVLSREA
jgi:UDP:flavonoid glycosyltransferase YjiC (YdhE family)